VQERLASKETDIANTAAMQDVESGIQLFCIHPAQILARNFPISKIAEIASRVAGIGDSNVAQGGTALRYEAHHVADLAPSTYHARRLDAPRAGVKDFFLKGEPVPQITEMY
jgi:hypothetical protein